MLDKEKHIRPDIKGEIEEIQRFSQELSRDEGIEVSVDEVIKSLKKSKEQLLTNDIWNVLENTESNEVEKGDWKTVEKIAREYRKTNPKVLKKEIESGEYKRPLIAELDGRYILMAGNTRLCTAAAMGVNINVFIANIEMDFELNEKWSEKYKKLIDCDNPKGFSQRAHCQGRKKTEAKEQTMAGSSGSFEAPAIGGMIRRHIHKIHNSKLNEQQQEVGEATDASSSGSYDVPLFGTSPKGRKNPLKIDGPDSIYKGRAVKDKKFPKWGGPDSVFVKIKEKCKKYPYCNQGNTGAIEFIKEDPELQTIINETSKKYGIPYNQLENIVLNEITKIFI
jgi:hypothetical protein